MRLKARGDDVRIAKTVIIKRPHLFSVGRRVSIDDYCVFTCQMQLGSFIHIAPLVTAIGGERALVQMGNFTTIAAGSRLAAASDEHLGAGLVSPLIPDAFRDNVNFAPIIFENFASIASNVVISPGVTLREGSVIGANSFVPANFVTEAWTIYVGSPARPLRTRPHAQMQAYARELGF